MGTPWKDQKLGIEPGRFLVDFRKAVKTQLVETGSFDRRTMDHNSTSYETAFSNKRVMIVGTLLLGRDPENYEEAFAAIVKVAL